MLWSHHEYEKDLPMTMLANVLVLLVALLHVWFMILEMFLWRTPIGLGTFGNTQQKADDSAVLAANQGLYNGFLAAGLVFGLLYPAALPALHIKTFFLACVIVAGLYGAWSVSRRILLVQALPALVALALTWLAA
jgi:putative membrane protein